MTELASFSGTADTVGPVVSRRRAVVVLTVLCAVFFALALVEAWTDSATEDEQYQFASGVTALTRHQLRVTPEQPAFFPAIAALPILAVHPAVPDTPAWRNGDGLAFSGEFMQAQARAHRLRRVVFAGRLIPVLEAMTVGIVLYTLGTALFGRAAGLLSAGAWLTLPFALGLGHLNSWDMTFALVVVTMSLTLLRYTRRPDGRGLALVGLISGAALLARPTGFVVVAVAAATTVVANVFYGRRSWKRGVISAGVVLVVAWGCVWAGYRVLSPRPQFRHRTPIAAVGPTPTFAKVLTAVPWPHEYAVGVRDQAVITSRPQPAFLLGHRWIGRRWWFVPGALLVKLTASTLITLVAGLACWKGLRRSTVLEAFLTVAVPAGVLGVFLVLEAENLGLRYALPAIALAMVAAGPLVRILRRGWAGRLGVGALAVAQLSWLAASVPHSLAWTAPPWRPGYRFASDSNIDWGQDGYRLERWVRRHPDAVVLYFGGSPVAWRLSPDGRASKPGWYAVSATFLEDYAPPLLGGYLVLNRYCPVTTIGGTIPVWHFERPPAADGRVTFRTPPVCRGRFSKPSR